jgi:hypothetical protein
MPVSSAFNLADGRLPRGGWSRFNVGGADAVLLRLLVLVQVAQVKAGATGGQ